MEASARRDPPSSTRRADPLEHASSSPTPNAAPPTLPDTPREAETSPASTSSSEQAASETEPGVNNPRRVRIFYSDKFLAHKSASGVHPERPERLLVSVQALRSDDSLKDLIEWREPTPVPPGSDRRRLVLKYVNAVHTFPDYLEELKAKSDGGGGGIDGDTYVAPGSYETALLAVSAWMDAVDHALDAAHGGPAWALVRPPGHHATRVSGMGFCLLSNAAIAAYYALRNVGHVGILDFDVHHGNGTEHAVRDEPRIRFTSSHEMPLFPGTGSPDMKGPHGTILNVPLSAGDTMEEYREVLLTKMIPHVLEHDEGKEQADLVLVSAGFDTLDVDPLASLDFKPEDFEEICREIVQRTRDECGHNRVVLGLEGGYDLGENGIASAVCFATHGLLSQGV